MMHMTAIKPEITSEIFSSINFENPLYFWLLQRKQKMMQEIPENWGTQVFIDWNNKFFGRSHLMNVMQNGTP